MGIVVVVLFHAQKASRISRLVEHFGGIHLDGKLSQDVHEQMWEIL